MIEARFQKRQGEFTLNASLSGEGMMLLKGPNGSGKTTLLKSVAGYIPVDSGSIRLNSIDVTDMPVSIRKAVYIGPDSYIGSLNVQDHLSWPRSPYSQIEKREVVDALGIDYDGKVGNLSLGQKMRVAIATGIVSAPRIILIDEVLANISGMADFAKAIGEVTFRKRIDVIAAMQTDELKDVFNLSYSISGGILTRTK